MVIPNTTVASHTLKCIDTYLVGVTDHDEKFERNGSQQINNEPVLHIIDSHSTRIAHYLIVCVDESRPKVYKNINYKHDVDNVIDNDEWIVDNKITATFVVIVLVGVVTLKIYISYSTPCINSDLNKILRCLSSQRWTLLCEKGYLP